MPTSLPSAKLPGVDREGLFMRVQQLPDGCWAWTRGRQKNGYGVVNHKGEGRLAHSVAWELLRGPIPTGQRLGHMCPNKACCNPDHLSLGKRRRGPVQTFTCIDQLLDRATPEPNTGCWLWAGGINEDGYGHVEHDRKNWTTHRLAWVLTHGAVPEGLCVCHKCDTPACINPDHLFIGTNADNILDRHRKGRDAVGDRNGSRARPETRPRGEANGRSKFTAEKVVEMRSAYAAGVYQAELARRYGVTPSAIRWILKGLNWS